MAAPVRNVIFLDMDGVLLPFPKPPISDDDDDDDDDDSQPLFPSSTLAPLKRLWEHVTHTNGHNSNSNSNTDVEWVLSSTWRVQASYIRDIEEALHTYGILLRFSSTTDPTLHSERQWEIQDWLDKQGLLSSLSFNACWLAIDDEELLEGDTNAQFRSIFQGHAILTKSDIGISQTDVDQAMQMWNHQQQQQQQQQQQDEQQQDELVITDGNEMDGIPYSPRSSTTTTN